MNAKSLWRLTAVSILSGVAIASTFQLSVRKDARQMSVRDDLEVSQKELEDNQRALGIQMVIRQIEPAKESPKIKVELTVSNGTTNSLFLDRRGFSSLSYRYMTIRGDHLPGPPSALTRPFDVTEHLIQVDPGEVWTSHIIAPRPVERVVREESILFQIVYVRWNVGLPDELDDVLFKSSFSSNIVQIDAPIR